MILSTLFFVNQVWSVFFSKKFLIKIKFCSLYWNSLKFHQIAKYTTCRFWFTINWIKKLGNENLHCVPILYVMSSKYFQWFFSIYIITFSSSIFSTSPKRLINLLSSHWFWKKKVGRCQTWIESFPRT